MTQLKKTSLAMIAAGLFTAGASGMAQADVLATSTLEMNNFQLLHSDNSIYDLSDFALISPRSSASISATYNGVNGTNVNGVLAGGPTPTGQIDLFPVCAGTVCNQNGSLVHGTNFNGVLDNAFPNLNSPGSPQLAGGNFVAADQYEAGSPVTGQIDPTTGLPISPPANVKSGSWTNLANPSGGPNNAEANNQLSTTFTFSLAQADSVTFDFDALLYQESYVSADQVFPASAQTSSQLFFKIFIVGNTTPIFTFAPTELNTGTAVNSPINGLERIGSAGGVPFTNHYTGVSPLLSAGVLYRLDATLKTTATGNTGEAVPEPNVLALLGIGLVGFAAMRRRKNQTAA